MDGKIALFGEADEKTLAQARDVASRAERLVLCADNHLGYIMPIGAVAAYDEKVSVAGVGFDIACGNAAIRTDLSVGRLFGMSREEIERNPHRFASNPAANRLADEIQEGLSFGIGRRNRADDAPVDDPLFNDEAWWLLPNSGPQQSFRDELLEKARRQLGTVGGGNHYVDIFADERGSLWVGVHFGSRGLGHTIASNFMALAQNRPWGERVAEGEALLDLGSQLGQDYWGLMQLAGRYAYAGREWVARKVVELMGGSEVELVHNSHNFAWREEHDGEELIVVRKGATPAFPGQKGFVGGSMGDDAVILRGSLNRGAEQKLALHSTVHGAGRVMSRSEAAGKWNRKRNVQKSPGKITAEMMQGWLAKRGVILRGGGLDEAPQAYRRLPEVLSAHGSTIEVLHTLRPLIVVMAGAHEFDPYKD